VFGSHLLETKHGEIRLRNFARILSDFGTIGYIEARTFERGRASHNLVVEGMVMPQNIQIIFNDNQQIRTLILNPGTWQDAPEIIVSGISLRMDRIDFNPSIQWVGMGGGGTADIVTNFLASGYVTLADGTQIYLPLRADGVPMDRVLLIDKEDERWKIYTRTGRRTTVRLPGETEFVDYRWIAFRPHWGEFIEGERID
jgi:hypothetical protein